MKRRRLLKSAAAIATAAAFSLSAAGPAAAENETLKIGFVGVTSGPAAAWGLANVRSMQALAAMMNEGGGVEIGDKTYTIEIVTFDTQKDPKRAIAGMEKMAQEGIHYVVGPNVDGSAAAVRPIAEQNGIIYFPYSFPKELYAPPASNAVLGMVANYQSGPAIYKYLMENEGVETVAFIAANESDPLSQRDSGVAAAKALGLEVVSDNVTYQADTTDFMPVILPVIQTQPDLLVLSGVAPANAPQLIRSARELGFEGFISTETAQDAQVLKQGAGELANGFISVGGASTPEIASDGMKAFVDRYTQMFGEYNDESNTKVYALQYIIDTLQAAPEAIDDVAVFKEAMKTFEAPNPFIEGDAKLRYVGMTSFGQK
ncbi:MAG TPA: ABC transporter substrate-binding protein, partial [Paracoccaceae bacterium]|nr:ABC transporter substrate-binding protein [Paracoccaceae bacterium]